MQEAELMAATSSSISLGSAIAQCAIYLHLQTAVQRQAQSVIAKGL
jgi:hypothetical protein